MTKAVGRPGSRNCSAKPAHRQDAPGDITADGEHLILAHTNAYRVLSLYLGEYHQVYPPIIVRAP